MYIKYHEGRYKWADGGTSGRVAGTCAGAGCALHMRRGRPSISLNNINH